MTRLCRSDEESISDVSNPPRSSLGGPTGIFALLSPMSRVSHVSSPPRFRPGSSSAHLRLRSSPVDSGLLKSAHPGNVFCCHIMQNAVAVMDALLVPVTWYISRDPSEADKGGLSLYFCIRLHHDCILYQSYHHGIFYREHITAFIKIKSTPTHQHQGDKHPFWAATDVA